MSVRKKICSVTIFVCIIVHILLGYLLKRFYGTNAGYGYGAFIYLLVPLMPFLVGLKRIKISYSFAIAILYVVICLTVQLATKNLESGPVKLWHPLWLMFLTIPIYYTFQIKSPWKKDKDQDKDKTHISSDEEWK